MGRKTTAWCVGPRQSVDISLNSISRDATRAIDKSIEWQDLVFDVGAEVTATLDVDQFKARWKYNFSDSERLEYYPTELFGVGLGFSNSQIEYSQSEGDDLVSVAYRVSALQDSLSFVF